MISREFIYISQSFVLHVKSYNIIVFFLSIYTFKETMQIKEAFKPSSTRKLGDVQDEKALKDGL